MTLKEYIEFLEGIVSSYPEIGEYQVKTNVPLSYYKCEDPFLDWQLAECEGDSIKKYYSESLPHEDANTILL